MNPRCLTRQEEQTLLQLLIQSLFLSSVFTQATFDHLQAVLITCAPFYVKQYRISAADSQLDLMFSENKKRQIYRINFNIFLFCFFSSLARARILRLWLFNSPMTMTAFVATWLKERVECIPLFFYEYHILCEIQWNPGRNQYAVPKRRYIQTGGKVPKLKKKRARIFLTLKASNCKKRNVAQMDVRACMLCRFISEDVQGK
jgi:hypothetical protein